MKSPSEDSWVHRGSNSQSGSSFGSAGVYSFTLSNTHGSMKCDSHASLLAHTFASPCFGHKPKVRVATQKIHLCWMLNNPTLEQFFKPIYIVWHLNGMFHNYALWIINCYATIFSKYQHYCLSLCQTYWADPISLGVLFASL
jgi:hypothetical protein